MSPKLKAQLQKLIIPVLLNAILVFITKKINDYKTKKGY